MAIFRCNRCGYLRQVTDEYISKTAKCPQCQTATPIYDTITFIEKILDRYFTIKKELSQLQQQNATPNLLEFQIVDTPEETSFSLSDIDIHNTTELTTNQQLQPIVAWFETRKITISVDPKDLDTTGFFDEMALELGNNYEVLREVSDKIKRTQNKGYTHVNFQLSTKSQKEIQEIVHFCNQLYKYSFVAKCYYQKKEKILKLTLQTATPIVHFFNGIWFEWFVFIQTFTLLQEKQVIFSGVRSLNVTFPNEDAYELDNFFLINNTIPLCIECKAGEFRQDLDKYARLRKRINIPPSHYLLCVAGLTDEQASGLTSMYEVTVVNEKTIIPYVEKLLMR